jgi:hypothetical protein
MRTDRQMIANSYSQLGFDGFFAVLGGHKVLWLANKINESTP